MAVLPVSSAEQGCLSAALWYLGVESHIREFVVVLNWMKVYSAVWLPGAILGQGMKMGCNTLISAHHYPLKYRKTIQICIPLFGYHFLYYVSPISLYPNKCL